MSFMKDPLHATGGNRLKPVDLNFFFADGRPTVQLQAGGIRIRDVARRVARLAMNHVQKSIWGRNQWRYSAQFLEF